MRSGTASSIRPYNKLFSVQEFGPGVVLETNVQHSNANGTGNFSSGIGFGNTNFGTVNSEFWTTGKFSSAASFADKNHSVNFGNKSNLQLANNITVDAWIKVNNYSNQAVNYFLAKNPGWGMYIGSNGSLNVLYNGSTTIAASGAFTSSDIGNWVHVAFTYDGSVTRLYKNGQSLTTTGTFTGSIALTSPLYAGQRGDSVWYFNGAIDEVRISNTVRYAGNFTAPVAPYTTDANTVGLWHFDENSGGTVNDSTTNVNTGTVTNAAGFNIHHYTGANWYKSASNIVGGQSTMAQTTDTNYHIQRVWWRAANEVRFQNDNNNWETLTTNIPSKTLPVWTSINSKNDNTSNGTLNIDWIRVRQITDIEPVASVSSEEQFDNIAPTGSISTNSNATYSDSHSVTLDLIASDNINDTGSLEMHISNNSDFSTGNYEVFAFTKNWNLASGEGSKTVYVKYRDTATNESITYSDTIVVDTINPTTPGLPNTTSPTNNVLPSWNWSASSDSGSGLASPAYTVEWSMDENFSNGVNVFSSSTNSFTHTSNLTEGEWFLRIKSEDLAGNSSAYSEIGSVLIDTSNPTGSIIINSDDANTNSPEVSLAIQAQDTVSEVAEMIVSDNEDFLGSVWETML